jgi:hypothetical protein
MSSTEINLAMLKLAELKLKLQLFELIPQLRFALDEKRRVLNESEDNLRVYRSQLDEIKAYF